MLCSAEHSKDKAPIVGLILRCSLPGDTVREMCRLGISQKARLLSLAWSPVDVRNPNRSLKIEQMLHAYDEI